MTNLVKCTPYPDQPGRVGDLIGDNYQDLHAAFIGQCGDGPAHALYLATYSAVVLLSNPRCTWELPGCPVSVTRFVDLRVSAIERSD